MFILECPVATQPLAGELQDSAVANVLAKPTHSGRFLLSATDQPLTPEQQLELAADMKDNPEAQEKLAELAGAAQMGLKLQYAKSPAFVGLLIVDLQSAELSGFKTPEIQFVCEDDKVCTAYSTCIAWEARCQQETRFNHLSREDLAPTPTECH
jgi:hypothetical protein